METTTTDAETIARACWRPTRMERIAREHAKRTGWTVLQLRGRERHGALDDDRRELMWLLHKRLPDLQITQIAVYMDWRHRMVVAKAIERHQARLDAGEVTS